VSQTDAAAVADALDSPDANERAWTGLKLVGDSVKTYTGTRDGMLMMDGKYRKVWGWWLFHHFIFAPSTTLCTAASRLAPFLWKTCTVNKGRLAR
jgi:hypothetical protein